MSDNSWWRGRVANKSKHTVWVIFDDSSGMRAKKLGSNRKTPDDVDADGVMGVLGFKISGWDQVWKLKNGAEANIISARFDGMAGDTIDENIIWIEQTSFIGSLVKVNESEFGKINFDNDDNTWGTKI
jgi:hypothetical protein